MSNTNQIQPRGEIRRNLESTTWYQIRNINQIIACLFISFHFLSPNSLRLWIWFWIRITSPKKNTWTKLLITDSAFLIYAYNVTWKLCQFKFDLLQYLWLDCNNAGAIVWFEVKRVLQNCWIALRQRETFFNTLAKRERPSEKKLCWANVFTWKWPGFWRWPNSFFRSPRWRRVWYSWWWACCADDPTITAPHLNLIAWYFFDKKFVENYEIGVDFFTFLRRKNKKFIGKK